MTVQAETDESDIPDDSHAPSPREIHKLYHPNYFSDSVAEDAPQLNRLSLENHLSTLGARKQEVDFENFAKAIIENMVGTPFFRHCFSFRPVKI